MSRMNSITNNIPSLIAQRVNGQNKMGLSNSLNKLSTGQRINRGADGPAQLISSEKLKAVLAMLEAETRVMQRVDSVATVAEGALSEASTLLIEAKGLAVANANTAGMSDAERAANQMEIDSILSSVDRISRNTNFNGDSLLDGTATFTAGGDTLNIDSIATSQIGDVSVSGASYTLSDVATGNSLNTATGNVAGAPQAIDRAITQVSTIRGTIGAFQKNTIQSGLRSIGVAIENTAAANSIIRDTDYASETSNLIRSQILDKSSLRMLDLANHSNSEVLSLLS